MSGNRFSDSLSGASIVIPDLRNSGGHENVARNLPTPLYAILERPQLNSVVAQNIRAIGIYEPKEEILNQSSFVSTVSAYADTGFSYLALPANISREALIKIWHSKGDMGLLAIYPKFGGNHDCSWRFTWKTIIRVEGKLEDKEYEKDDLWASGILCHKPQQLDVLNGSSNKAYAGLQKFFRFSGPNSMDRQSVKAILKAGVKALIFSAEAVPEKIKNGRVEAVRTEPTPVGQFRACSEIVQNAIDEIRQELLAEKPAVQIAAQSGVLKTQAAHS